MSFPAAAGGCCGFGSSGLCGSGLSAERARRQLVADCRAPASGGEGKGKLATCRSQTITSAGAQSLNHTLMKAVVQADSIQYFTNQWKQRMFRTALRLQESVPIYEFSIAYILFESFIGPALDVHSLYAFKCAYPPHPTYMPWLQIKHVGPKATSTV